MEKSNELLYYEQLFFQAKLWKTEPHEFVLENYRKDEKITKEEREYILREYNIS
jgi:hypothetical protein